MSSVVEDPLLLSNPPRPRYIRWLANGFFALSGLTVALMVLGALVRAHGAGLACPDWPLCFGEFIPSIDFKVAFEFSHRVFAGSISLAFVTLSLLSLRQAALRQAIGKGLLLAGIALFIQIILGALTVWLKLAVWTVSAHLLTANFFVVTIFCVALSLNDLEHSTPRQQASFSVRLGFLAVAVLLVAQIALGGLVSSSYAGLACPAWPSCNGDSWFPSWRGTVGLHLLHRMNAYLLLSAMLCLLWVCAANKQLIKPAVFILSLGFAQVLVGIANVVGGLPVEVTGLHSALAAILILGLSYGNWHAWRANPGGETRNRVLNTPQ